RTHRKNLARVKSVGWCIGRRVTSDDRFGRAGLAQHVNKLLVPVRLEAHVAVDLERVFLTLPKLFSMRARPADPFAGTGVESLSSHLLRPRFHDETMRVVLGNVLPYHTRENTLRVRGLFEHVFQCPLAFGIAVAGDLDEDTLV